MVTHYNPSQYLTSSPVGSPPHPHPAADNGQGPAYGQPSPAYSQQPQSASTDDGGLQTAHDETGLHPVAMFQTNHHAHNGGGMNGASEKEGLADTVSPLFSAASPTMVPSTATTHSLHHKASADPDQFRAEHHQAAASTAYSEYSPPSTRHPGEKKILGMNRTVFFLALSNVVLAIGMVLVGVLLSQLNKPESCTNIAGAAAQGSGANPTSSNVPTVTGSSSPDALCWSTAKTVTSDTDLGRVTSDCPRSETKQRYTVPKTSLTFERTCGLDISGNDLGRLPTTSMADCIHLCAQLNLFPTSAMGRCLGVTWLFGDGVQGIGSSYCYLKSNVTGDGDKLASVESAVLLE